MRLYCFFLKKMGELDLFFVYFRSFQTKNTIFTTNQSPKYPKCPSSIWRIDLNPQPFEQESSPITTRPGLQPLRYCYTMSISNVGSSIVVSTY